MSLSPLAALLSRKRLLIFDLDGTLVDSSPLHARAFSEAFASQGVEVDYSTIAGMTTEAAVDKVAAAAGLALEPPVRERLVADKRARALRLIETELGAIEGAVDFVAAARLRFRLALATSASRRGASAALARVGLEHSFDAVVTAEDVAHGKPDPEPFLNAAAAAAVDPAHALVFEDADSGMDAARAAGMDVVRIGPEGEGGTGWRALVAALEEIA